jgi:hypothetical protein
MSSAGWLLTKTFGTADALIDFPGSAALTSFQFSSAGSFLKLSGSVPAGDQDPFTSRAFTVRVHREFQIVLFDRAPHRLAVEIHDDRGRLAEEDRRRVGFDAFDVFRHDLALVQVREDAIKRDHTLVVGNRFVDLGDDLAHLLFRQGLEVGFGDLHVLEPDEPLVERDLRVPLELDRSNRRLVGGLGAVRHCAERHYVGLLVPTGHLGLIDQKAGAARDVIDPRPAAVGDRRHAGGRRLRLG